MADAELEAIASGAKRCAASKMPILSLSRTFDHETSRISSIASLPRRRSRVDGNYQGRRVD